MVTRKLKRSVPSLLPHPPVLAHTIYQAVSFDGALREEGFDLCGTSAETTPGQNEWKGISDTILGRSDWFNAWLQGEKQCKRLPSYWEFSFSKPSDGHLFVSLGDLSYLHSISPSHGHLGFSSRIESVSCFDNLGRPLANGR